MSIFEKAVRTSHSLIPSRRRMSIKKGILGLLILIMVVAIILVRPPRQFPEGAIVKVPEGMTASALAPLLHQENIIRSEKIFVTVMRFVHEGALIAGDYQFDTKTSLLDVARRLKEGDFGVQTVTITIPEGSSTNELIAIVSSELPALNTQSFRQQAEELVGYLYPNTYIVPVTITEQELIARMKDLFDKETMDLQEKAKSGRRSWNDIVKMASILEKEAHTERDRRMIADVLWRRLDEGMRLQVDAPFLALEGKGSSVITQDDLFNDSPYNTYRNDGLTPTPITNPGLESLEAALDPIKNDYFYYLADSTGKTHFSTTFEEHVKKKQQYLRE